jgi:Fe2+ transport system protein FeoA
MECCSLLNTKERDICEILSFGNNIQKNSRLFSLGLVPGKKIKIIECYKNYFLISTGGNQLGLSTDMIKEIEVKLCR